MERTLGSFDSDRRDFCVSEIKIVNKWIIAPFLVSLIIKTD